MIRNRKEEKYKKQNNQGVSLLHWVVIEFAFLNKSYNKKGVAVMYQDGGLNIE